MKRGINVVEIEPVHAMAIRRRVTMDQLPTFFGEAYSQLEEYFARKGGKVAGQPFAAYYDVHDGEVDIEAGFPVVFDVLENLPAEGEIHPVDYPGGEAIEYVYFGPYDGMGLAYDDVAKWLLEHHHRATGPGREVYYSDPGEKPNPEDWETHIVQRFN